ncbi:MAG: ribosome small subunit-dependent GTPase A [Cyclobacteriaceae bacterium]
MKGLVVKSTGSWYEVRTENGKTYKARLRGKFKLKESKITNPIAVGDWVEFDERSAGEEYYVITELHKRTNYIVRKSPKKAGHAHMIASNVELLVIIATFNKPRTSLGFIDRLLVTAESYRIPCLIVFNKEDLLDEEDWEILDEIRAMYEYIGYDSILLSAKTGKNLDELEKAIEGKIVLFSGHSGTGKSTLINKLIPEADQQTKEISDFANKGVHTTTFAEMFFTKQNGFIIDTPGIKELGLMEIEDTELSHFFPEMREYLGECKYHNCQHTIEPHCKIREAVKSGEVPPPRYDSYLSMLENEDNRR